MSCYNQTNSRTCHNSHMLSPTSIGIKRKTSQASLFATPTSPKSYTSDPCNMFSSPSSKQRMLLRTNSGWVSQNPGQIVRKSRIFKNKQHNIAGQNAIPVCANFRIINYGPIKLTEAKREEKLAIKQQDKEYKKWSDTKSKHVSFNDYKNDTDLKNTKIEEDQFLRYYDTSHTTAEIQSFFEQSGQTSQRKQCNEDKQLLESQDDKEQFGQNSYILNSKIMEPFQETMCKEAEDKNTVEAKLKQIQTKHRQEIVKAWSACIICIFIILGLLLFK